MSGWKRVLVRETASIREAVQVLDASSMQIVLVVNGEGRLLGTLTDGDVRRAILKGRSMEDAVNRVMNAAPTASGPNESRESLLAIMQKRKLRHIPLLDENGHVVGLETLEDLIQAHRKENVVVLMAGGLGSRLRPLTDDCPKPMLRVGTKPLLETILESFIDHGFRRFFISVNYMAEMVQAHFRDGSRWGAEIDYLQEGRQLGTAGALSLLPEAHGKPILVMNGDILTKVNFTQLLEFHAFHGALGTMCVREYDLQIPYGVVQVEDHRMLTIQEKPVHRYFVNAGIYVLEPASLDLIPKGERYDMPALFERMAKEKKETAVFPIHEYWLDIGQMADYDRANGEFMQVFA